MPWRFRRSVKILPGVRWNIGKKGSSVTIGGRGLKTTMGHGKVRQTVGIPGTGLSYTSTSSSKKRSKSACCPLALLLLLFFAIQGIFKWLISPFRKTNID
ncbi:MAG: DUF4236 domain-containing protein [Chloroflexota bacterium]|nr:DUF4236 domain-containing protein [Chloroflexota bacterium]MBI5705258.1 DUF4236 domain-containing protein [Chloroflexota bacterium]